VANAQCLYFRNLRLLWQMDVDSGSLTVVRESVRGKVGENVFCLCCVTAIAMVTE